MFNHNTFNMIPCRRKLSIFGSRLLASQTAPVPAREESVREEPQITKLVNGVQVISVENLWPVSRVALVVNAGSRHESTFNLGITHCLRNNVALASSESSYFGNVRSLEKVGASVIASTTRDYLTYSVECLRDGLEEGVEVLGRLTTKQAFKPWEIKDATARLKMDIARYKEQPYLRVTDLIHEAAFRTTLGRSLHMPEHMIGKHNNKMLAEYVLQYYTPERMAVVGFGVPHDVLKQYVQEYFTPYPSRGVTIEPAKFGGGEVRQETGYPIVHTMIVSEGAGICSKDAVALALAQHILGTGPHTKYGTCTGLLNRATQGCSKNPFMVSSINASYSDSGLFGFHVVGHANDMSEILKCCIQQYRSLSKAGVSDQQAQTAKHQLKTTILMAMEDPKVAFEELGGAALTSGSLLTADSVSQQIDSVTTAEINSVLKRVVSSKQAMAAIGDLGKTPYLDQLL